MCGELKSFMEKISTTKVAKKYNINRDMLFKKLLEVEFIFRFNGRYRLTKKGVKNGGSYKSDRDGGTYIVWSEKLKIKKNKKYQETSNIKAYKTKSNSKYKRRYIPQKVKDQVWNRDSGKCVVCGTNENIEFDHIIPKSKGGADSYRNLQLLCQYHNKSKGVQVG